MHFRCILVQQQESSKNTPPNLLNCVNPISFCFFSQFAMNVLIRLKDWYSKSGFEAGLFQSVNNQNHYDLSSELWDRDILLCA